ncbi:MAG: diphosphomevalonate decarboxylase [Caldilineaceae bacterium]|nr:diphosphomevalonate decarboxylase [Caldilineaceae bacterium]
MRKSTIRAGSNIAFIKYWGVDDATINLPQNNSISMTLADAHTTTTVEWLPRQQLAQDRITLDGVTLDDRKAARLVRHLDRIRTLAATDWRARVVSQNNFPMASGIASSASGFAALTVAACQALALPLEPTQLSALARRGSGSASRSLWGGFVEWDRGVDDATSVAHQLYPADHWLLYDVVAVVSGAEKAVSSEQGHRLATSSPLNRGRVDSVPQALAEVRAALAERDLSRLGPVIEQDALMMHAVMMTGTPGLFYWQPGTLEIIQAIRQWREQDGVQAYYTIDAGPNLHIICEAETINTVQERLRTLAGVQQILTSRPGLAPFVVAEPLF